MVASVARCLLLGHPVGMDARTQRLYHVDGMRLCIGLPSTECIVQRTFMSINFGQAITISPRVRNFGTVAIAAAAILEMQRHCAPPKYAVSPRDPLCYTHHACYRHQAKPRAFKARAHRAAHQQYRRSPRLLPRLPRRAPRVRGARHHGPPALR